MGYTKGRWEVRYQINVFCGRRLVANCGGYQSNVDSDGVDAENRANARLIANAQRVLITLHRIKESYQSCMAECDVEDIESLLADAGLEV